METKPDLVPPGKERSAYFYLNNWISLAGVVVAIGAAFAFVLLFAIDTLSKGANPYVGILTYLASPAFFFLGMGMLFAGWLVHRRQIARSSTGESSLTFSFDFSQARHRRNFFLFTGGTFVFLMLTAFGSYKTYHFSESVEFCGLVCHSVMEPEYVTHQLGAHARITCAECHIGSGATWFVKSKISGLYQVYSTAFDKYSRPIATPVHNLRPAQETCEQCHWPQKFTGNLDRLYPRYLADDDNTPYHVRLSLKVGGGDPRRGPVGGIHWHMTVANKVEYIATDPQRQEIPWVRVTSQAGEVTEYRVSGFTDDPSHHVIRTMDCVDCHNRPAHVYLSPNEAVDRALYIGRLDRSLEGLKRTAVELLTAEYASREEALAAIAAGVADVWPDDARITATTAEIQQIYSDNFFPGMKVTWEAYPNNLSHKDWPGCFRCHSDEHVSTDGRQISPMSDCNACHTILAQGSTAAELRVLHPDGDEFRHPAGDVGGFLCSDCHFGGLLD
jgi:hypothetical protein